MKVGALVRVSTKKQDVESQRYAVSKWHDANPEHELTWYDEGKVSGAKKADKRPGLTKLLDDCRAKKIEAVVVTEFSRMSRRDQWESVDLVRSIVSAGARLYFVFDDEWFVPADPDSKFRLASRAYVSEKERLAISRRTKNHLEMKREKCRREGVPDYVGAPGFLWTPEKDAELLALLPTMPPRKIAREGLLFLARRKKGEDGKWTSAAPKAVSEGAIYARLDVLGVDSHGRPRDAA